jgi:hypothetical protein
MGLGNDNSIGYCLQVYFQKEKENQILSDNVDHNVINWTLQCSCTLVHVPMFDTPQKVTLERSVPKDD